jgi:hypothetical protein
MTNAFWWQEKGYVNYLVDMAADLDRQYPGRALYAVGHSPSWLVYAAGELRKARGEAPKVGFIPHSGSLHEVARDDMFKTATAQTTVHYHENANKEASPQALGKYFNFLSRRHLDPQSVRQTYAADGAPVLVDFVAKGNGFATFLRLYNDLAEKQGTKGPAAGGFDIHAFKMAYADGPVTLAIDPVRHTSGTVQEFNVAVTTGLKGSLMNRLAGFSGYAAANDQSARRLDAGRFMPYYPVADAYRKDSYTRDYPPPVNGLRVAMPDHERRVEIKSLIRAAVAQTLAAPDEHKNLSTAAAGHIDRNAPRQAEGQPARWTFSRGYH